MSPAVPVAACCAHNPRASSGALHGHNPRTSSSSVAITRGPYGTSPSSSPKDSVCSACSYDEDGLPLNTPYSTPPTSNAGSVARRARRRSSVSAESRPVISTSKGGHHNRAPSPPRPVVIQKQRSASRDRSREHHSSGRTLVVPASSHGHRRSRSDTTSYKTHTGRYYEEYTRSIEHAREQESTEVQRRGRTRFPKNLVSREAVEETNYPFAIEDNGAITVLQALAQPDIEALVARTEEIRRRSQSRKAVSFYEKTLVHEVPPSAPSPPPSEAGDHDHLLPPPRSGTPISPEMFNKNHHKNVVLVPGSSSRHSSRSSYRYAPSSTYLSNSPPKIEPLSPPGPSTPKPGQSKQLSLTIDPPQSSHTLSIKTPEERLAKAEEKALKAERIAEKKEKRALQTRRADDQHEAHKAWSRAEELNAKVREKKEKMLGYEKLKQRSERESRHRVGRNHRGEIVLIKS
ncbi:hypothetical protein FN846DRAFT_890605 [Sphaerosporella brunnea]|uniref:DUF8035 domain-containing protein n=1 Tax=Sphaerosporella brunnea TaxID=1250544 RepID=A0A5J5EVW8_9PEZI|nr:hypothetical protein FN846DRAFT_890605 [Sphaerosporella brunnea]